MELTSLSPREDCAAVIPAYGCAGTIGEVVRGALETLSRVVVVDDGSADDTGALAQAAGAEVVRHERNLGKGEALRTGLEHALAQGVEALVFMDADGQHDPSDLPALLEAWDEGDHDLIVGARLSDPESIPGARFWTNYIGTRILTWMTGRELLDSQSGFRILSASMARKMGLRSRGYAIETEMLMKTVRLGGSIAHVPVQTIYHDHGGSHFRPVLDTVFIACAAIYFKVFDED